MPLLKKFILTLIVYKNQEHLYLGTCIRAAILSHGRGYPGQLILASFVLFFFLDGEASLIYSKGNSIQRLSLPPRPNDVGIIYQRPGAVHVGVDYDCVEQMVYWTEVIKGTIVRAKYDGSDMEVIVNSGKTTSPEGKINISS